VTPESVYAWVTLKENRAMVDWSIDEVVEEEVVEVESKVEKFLQNSRFLYH
jgi:CRISPR/Cas system Type II protein with McrA/HNH and RuvC-like nuclease domain